MKRNIVIATVTAAALVGGGTLVTTAAFARRRQRAAKDDRTSRATDRDDRDAAATATTATGITVGRGRWPPRLKAVPGTVTEAELDEDDARPWSGSVDVNGKTRPGTSVEVDPGTRQGPRSRVDKDDDGTTPPRPPGSPPPSGRLDQRGRRGARRRGKGTVTSVDLDDDGKAGAWEVDDDRRKVPSHDWQASA